MTSTTAVVSDTKEGELLARVATRPPCPFYGFVGMMGVFVDNHGNACGIAGGHRPCAMEMDSETPDWKKCTRFNHDENLRKIRHAFDRCKIFPEELRPKNASSWEGISLRVWYQWYQLIMRD